LADEEPGWLSRATPGRVAGECPSWEDSHWRDVAAPETPPGTPDNCIPDPYYVAPASCSLLVGGWGVLCANDEGGHWLFWHSAREDAQAADAMNRHRRVSQQTNRGGSHPWP
jgi:hypothetical protein